MTKAEQFIQAARKLLPHHDDLQDIDPAIDDLEVIDEIMFHKSEYLGGMAAAIIASIRAGA